MAERGRSLGIVLIGAQQTASEVERRVVANSAIRVVGRLDPAEAGRPEYGFLGEIARKRATILKPGSMFVAQPELPVPLLVHFPFPAWATRSSEAGANPASTVPEDPFAGLPKFCSCPGAAAREVSRSAATHSPEWSCLRPVWQRPGRPSVGRTVVQDSPSTDRAKNPLVGNAGSRPKLRRKPPHRILGARPTAPIWRQERRG